MAVVFALAAVLTWGKWPDPIVDYGAQLYLPWRISTGAVLYRDLFYIGGGPFSQYFDAALFKIFGASALTLASANMIFVAGILGLIYRRFLAASNALTATIIGLGIALVFVFNEYTLTGNYNFITPYSEEALHGLLLSIVVIVWMSDWVAKMRLRLAMAAGFETGLVFLTKPDIFLALAVGVAAGFILFAVTRRKILFVAKSLGAFLAGGVLPPLFFLWLFLRTENWRDSLRSVVFGWLPVFQPAVVNNPFIAGAWGWMLRCFIWNNWPCNPPASCWWWDFTRWR
ncbi:MAG: hypothetical protein ACLQSR_13365 [Limisphaerales bacterium]